jgi:adenosylcobinamide-GDP ribazoletransferase
VTGAPLQRRFLPVAECPISAHRLQHQLAVMDDDAFDRDRAWPPDFGAWWSDLRVAAAFLTRLPIRQEEPGRLSALPRAARCFPLVGLGIGLAAGVVYAVAIELVLPPILAAVLAVAAAVLVTGALHEDGLADTADGFGGGGDREAKLRIMRDSRIGTYGVVALILALAAQVAALSVLADSDAVVATLIVCHAASRALLVPVMHLESPARSDGLAVSAGRPNPSTTLWALGIAGLAALIFAGFDGVIASLIGAAVAWLVVRTARRQIGGITGDVLGTVQQTTAIAMLLALVALE